MNVTTMSMAGSLNMARWRQVALTVVLSVLVGLVITQVSRWVTLYTNVYPEQFARKNVALYRDKLHLTAAQEERTRAILVQHKEAVNQKERQELEQWERLFASLATDSDENLRQQIKHINALATERNEIRLRTLLQLRQEFNEDQKRRYGQYVSQVVRDYIHMLVRVFGQVGG